MDDTKLLDIIEFISLLLVVCGTLCLFKADKKTPIPDTKTMKIGGLPEGLVTVINFWRFWGYCLLILAPIVQGIRFFL